MLCTLVAQQYSMSSFSLIQQLHTPPQQNSQPLALSWTQSNSGSKDKVVTNISHTKNDVDGLGNIVPSDRKKSCVFLNVHLVFAVIFSTNYSTIFTDIQLNVFVCFEKDGRFRLCGVGQSTVAWIKCCWCCRNMWSTFFTIFWHSFITQQSICSSRSSSIHQTFVFFFIVTYWVMTLTTLI